MQDIFSYIKRIPLFANLTAKTRDHLTSALTLRQFAAGEALFEAGTPHTEMYIVLWGETAIFQPSPDGERQVATLGEGNLIGEGALLDDGVHSTTCRAAVDVGALVFTKSNLDVLFDIAPAEARLILEEVTRSVVRRLRSTNLAGRISWSGGPTRIEKDLLGERPVPVDAYFGIQTLRAMENFRITDIPVSHFPNFVRGLVFVKKAAALTNKELGGLAPELADAITLACDEILAGNLHHHFTVDVIQGGAGTSTNMNANEVIANRALEILGHPKGAYDHLHPNNHVNMAQSTNDAYPTAIRLAVLLSYGQLTASLQSLMDALDRKSKEFADVVKMGRTQLQDAVPMTLGQEFGAFRTSVGEDVNRLTEAVRLFQEVNLGGTAIGTGLNADPRYAVRVTEILSDLTGVNMISARDLIEATSDTGAFVTLSGVLRRIAVKVSKICNDLRLLSSGPRTGLNEINLPVMQPGSSIMPGKVNPVIPEVMNQIAYQVVGNDLTVVMAAEAGQLQLNVMEPVIAFNILQSIRLMNRGIRTLTDQCIVGITANSDHCRVLVENSIGLITAVNDHIGYENSSRIAKKALEAGVGVKELLLEEKLLTKEELDRILDPTAMTGR